MDPIYDCLNYPIIWRNFGLSISKGDSLKRAIPTYELYGELLSGSYSYPVHHESIRERSSKHDWTIRLHRHSSVAQIFVFRTSGVFLRLNEVEHTSTEPLILVVPPGMAHGFKFSEDVVGDVLSLPTRDLDHETRDRLALFAQGAAPVFTQSNAAHFANIDALMQQLKGIYHTVGPERTAMLRAITQLMVIYLYSDMREQMNLAGAPDSQHMTRHEMQAQKFCSLIEAHFTGDTLVAEYARMIGVSAPHLTRICKRILGSTPNALVRQRRIVEAKRLLEYTRLPVSEIVHRSGFRDPAFFSRAFKTSVGLTPSDYRQTSD